jgi:hypothetical protein
MRNSAAMVTNHWNFEENDLMIDMFPNAWGCYENIIQPGENFAEADM